MQDLLQRLQRLEDLEAIRRLKHRYLNACDRKDIEAIRSCFAAGDIHIDFGPIGLFRTREAFLAVYQTLACHAAVIDLHHGANEEIDLVGTDEATATWALYYFNLDANSGLTRQLGGTYEDRYRRTDMGWQIVSSVARMHSAVAGRTLEDSQ